MNRAHRVSLALAGGVLLTMFACPVSANPCDHFRAALTEADSDGVLEPSEALLLLHHDETLRQTAYDVYESIDDPKVAAVLDPLRAIRGEIRQMDQAVLVWSMARYQAGASAESSVHAIEMLARISHQGDTGLKFQAPTGSNTARTV